MNAKMTKLESYATAQSTKYETDTTIAIDIEYIIDIVLFVPSTKCTLFGCVIVRVTF